MTSATTVPRPDDYGATTGQVNKTVTRMAIQAIFDEISTRYPDQPPTQDGESAVVFFPFDAGGWWTDQTLTYTGSVSTGVYLVGEHSLTRGGVQGTALVYDGTAGGTLLDCLAITVTAS